MTVRVNKGSFNIREKLTELGRRFGLKGSEIMAAETVQDVRDLVSAGRRNLIINGDMRVAQRGTSFTTPSSGAYTIDRFQAYQASPGSAYNVTRETDVPTGQGFTHSLKITSASAASIVAGTYHYFGQKIEGYDWARLEYGTSNAKTITISFWVKSSLPGIHSGAIKNSAQGRSFVWEYTINSANTWEYKSITVPGCTDGTWLTDSGIGAWIYFSAGVGSTYETSTPGTWQSANLVGSANGIDLTAVNGATWYMTGLQVEVGKNATEFEHRSYGEELALCQRYYIQYTTSSDFRFAAIRSNGSSTQSQIVAFPTTMRGVPSDKTVITQPTTALLVRALDDTTGASYTTLSVNANTADGYYVTANVALSNAAQILVFNAVYSFNAEL